MKGTEQYWQYVTPGRHGNLWVTKGRHARGNTLHVYVIPDGVECRSNGDMNPPICDGHAVEVFGVTGGNRGWTETYGWLKNGPWNDDFERLVTSGRLEAEYKEAMKTAQDAESFEQGVIKDKEVLDNYRGFDDLDLTS